MKAFSALVCLTGLILGLANVPGAQVTEVWQARYSGSGNDADIPYDLAVDANGDVYVTGYSIGNVTGYDYCTIKYTAPGDTQWVARFNGSGGLADFATSLAVDANFNVFVTGGAGGGGTTTIKYNAFGVQQWIASVNSWGSSGLRIVLDGSGNVYVTGVCTQYTGSATDYLTIKHNSAGVVQWAAYYNGPGDGNDVPSSLAVDGNGNVYVTGWSDAESGANINYDYCTIKYNSAGVQQWVVRYNGPGNGNDEANSMILDASGNVYVTGGSVGSGTGYDYCTIKYNSAGVQQWVSRYNGPGNGNDVARDIIQDLVYSIWLHVTGYSAGNGTGYDYATLKYSTSGGQEWALRYNGTGNSDDMACKLATDSDGNVYVTGSGVAGTAGTDYATVKYSSVGVQQWAIIYNNAMANSNDDPVDLALDASKNVYVTGSSFWGGINNFDYLTIQYRQGPPLTFDVEVAPVNPPITIPANGGSFQFNAFVRRVLAPQAPFMVWTRDRYPNGTYTSALLGPITINPPVFVSLTRMRTQNVPGSWPAGVHTYLGYANTTYTYPANDSDHFIWTKSATADGTDLWDFSCTGEPFLGEKAVSLQPSGFSLSSISPNPFNPTTAISYELRAASYVTLRVYDTAGREIATLVDGWREVGTHSINFDGNELAAGVYLVRLEASGFTATQKMVLL